MRPGAHAWKVFADLDPSGTFSMNWMRAGAIGPHPTGIWRAGLMCQPGRPLPVLSVDRMGLRDRQHQLQAAPAGDRVRALMLATSRRTDASSFCRAGGGRLGIRPNAVVGANRRLSQGALGWPRFFSVWAPSGDTGSEQIEVRCTSIRDARSANWGMGCRRRPGESNHVQPAHGTRAHEHGAGLIDAQLDWAAWGMGAVGKTSREGSAGFGYHAGSAFSDGKPVPAV
jgi:hypothetical protein